MENERLNQFDFIVNEDFEDSIVDYRDFIGELIMRFSELEHELNLVISDLINDRSHDLGYMILPLLSMRQKIDLFGKLQSAFEKIVKGKISSKEIHKRLIDINSFRNTIAHANWYTIKTNGDVRVKILTKEGNLPEFKFQKITIQKIEKYINEIDEVSLLLGEEYRI